MIDTHVHCHLINQPPQQIWEESRQAGVTHMIQVAIDEDSIAFNQTLANTYDWCSATAGIHPLSVQPDMDINHILGVLDQVKSNIVAIGEIGLDYKYGQDLQSLQAEWFHAQLSFAKEAKLPVIIHSRQCDADMLAIVNQYPDLKKVFHCYATDVSFYEQLKGDHNYVSFTGMITFAKKGKVIRALKQIDLNRLMLETDAPYLNPKEAKDGQNHPKNIVHIARAIAEHRNIDLDEVVKQTNQNAIDFFSLEL